MKHPLFVGHFDESVRSLRPKVTKPIDLDRVHAILIAHCDKGPDGSPMIAKVTIDCAVADHEWLGRLGQEDVVAKAGYLICPWLGIGINKASMRFIRDLHSTIEAQIFDPGDGVFYSPDQLAAIEHEFYQDDDV